MLKKVITYEDYNGVVRTEECYFNMTKAELIEMHQNTGTGLDGLIMKEIIQEKNSTKLVKFLKELLVMSYGKKSDDGRLFMKNDEIRAEFMASPMYDILYSEIFTNEQAAADFIDGILPKSLKEAAEAAMAAKNAQPALTVG